MAEKEELELGKFDDEEVEASSSYPVVGSSDGGEDCEHLSFKIDEGAMFQGCSIVLDDDVLNELIDTTGDLSSPEAESVGLEERIDKKREWREKKKMKAPEESVDGAKMEENKEKSPISDKSVLRKLIRGPRYFDPPGGAWATCYYCGEPGHRPMNCTAFQRRKPCFICASLEHNNKQCKKGRYCFICKKGGHNAKSCPDKYQSGFHNSRICYKCGSLGHDMFTCKNEYSADDLKEIQCYMCKGFGHLCCANFSNVGPREVSCYRCGLLGHTGLECPRSRVGPLSVVTQSQGEALSLVSPNSCNGFGEEGHIAETTHGLGQEESKKGDRGLRYTNRKRYHLRR